MAIIIGFCLSLIVGGWAYRRKSLSISGLWGAVLIGTLYFGIGDIKWFGILLLFFFSSSFLSHFKSKDKEKLEEGYEKTGNRDFGQTMANGGLGGLLIIFARLFPEWENLIYVSFLGVMASVTADTWASEVGVLSRKPPKQIFTRRLVEPGRSGGVTSIGTIAGGIGAFIIGSIGLLLLYIDAQFPFLFFIVAVVIITVSGMLGSVVDSLLGAWFQRMNRCRVCDQSVESDTHCNVPTTYLRGFRWLNNDLVNSLSSLSGGMIALIVSYFLLY